MEDIIDHLHYLGVLVACVAVTAPLEPLGRGVYRRARCLVLALAAPAALFLAWDLVGVARGHWSFDHGQVLGVWVGPVPLEEVLFFLVVPVCSLLTLEAVRGLLARGSRARRARVTQAADGGGGRHA